jgi:cyanophycinase
MTIYLAGGTPQTTPGDAYDRFVQQAQPLGTRVAIAVPGTHAEAVDAVPAYAEPILRRWPAAQIEPLWLVGAHETSWPADPVGLAGIVLGDGHMAECLDSLAVHRGEIVRLIHRGAPLLGFGAGAMAVSRHAIIGGWRHQGRIVASQEVSHGLEEVVVRDGLGLIGVIVETHADTAAVLERAIAALHIAQAASAATIDEGVCLAVEASSGRTRVYGAGTITWLSQHGDQIELRFERADGAATPAPEL